MLIIFMEILQVDCYAVPELPPSRNPLHYCIMHTFENKTCMNAQSVALSDI